MKISSFYLVIAGNLLATLSMCVYVEKSGVFLWLKETGFCLNLKDEQKLGTRYAGVSVLGSDRLFSHKTENIKTNTQLVRGSSVRAGT